MKKAEGPNVCPSNTNTRFIYAWNETPKCMEPPILSDAYIYVHTLKARTHTNSGAVYTHSVYIYTHTLYIHTLKARTHTQTAALSSPLTFQYQSLSLHSVSPRGSAPPGGSILTIKGEGFAPPASPCGLQCRFGASGHVPAQYVSFREITCVVPPAAGTSCMSARMYVCT